MDRWKCFVQKAVKRHKRKAMLHTSIAGGVLFLLLAGLKIPNPVVIGEKGQDALLTISIVGDMMFGRNVELMANKHGYAHLFHYVHPYLSRSDIATGNFENALVTDGDYPQADKWIHLKCKPDVAEVLNKVGFKVLNVANNHTKDYGDEGLMDTLSVLHQHGVETVGAGRDVKQASHVVYRQEKGVKIAFIGMSDVLPYTFTANTYRSGVLPADPHLFRPLIKEAKQHADLVLIHIHWGVEYNHQVDPRQRQLGHALVDAGADVVVGHHPHVLEPIEVYKQGVIFYSLGNFIFDQGWSRTKESVLVQYRIQADHRVRIELYPIFICEGEPRPVSGWGQIYRREKIWMQITKERMYTDAWNRVWKRKGDIIYRVMPFGVRGGKGA